MSKDENKTTETDDNFDQSEMYIVIAFLVSLIVGLAVAGWVIFTMAG